MRPPRYTLRIDGYDLVEVNSLSLRFSVLELADSFQATISDKVRIREGQRAEVLIEGRSVLVGEVINSRLAKSPGARALSISGFSASQRLAKSSIVDTTSTYRDLTLEQIVTRVVKPFGLVVDVSASALEAATEVIEQAKVGPGQTAAGFLHEICKRKGCILVSGAASVGDEREAKSSVMITQSGVRTSPVIVESPSPRVLSFEMEADARDVHSRYIITRRGKGSRNPTSGQLEDVSGEATDDRVLYSPKIIQATGGGKSQADLDRQAEWEMRKRAAEGSRVSINIAGWSPRPSPTPPAPLWWPNTLYQVVDIEEDFDELMLLVSVELGESIGPGAVARLEFIPPDAYAILKERTIKGPRKNVSKSKGFVRYLAEGVGGFAVGVSTLDPSGVNLDLIYKPEDPDA